MAAKPKSKKAMRLMEDREPKLIENAKTAVFVKDNKSGDVVNSVIREMAMLKKPDAVILQHKQKVLPFEDATPLERISQKYDASLFVYGSNSKKRPNNLVFVRMFDHLVLDMLEVGVKHFKSLTEFPAMHQVFSNSRPAFSFIGEQFQLIPEFKAFSNMLLDFFRGLQLDQVELSGMEHVIICTSTPTTVYFRLYHVLLKKSGTKLPKVELAECGPQIDFVLRRHRSASEDVMKFAVKQPKQLEAKKVKNISTDITGRKGTFHMGRQDLSEMATRNMKAFDKKRSIPMDDDAAPETQPSANKVQKKV